MPIKPGEVLNRRYRIEKSIGAGGYGEVYLAYDQSLDVRVAVKRNLDRSLIAQEQFQREARLLAGLKHPNLPRVSHHFVVATGEQYLVMDYIAGENLDSLMRRRGKLPPREVFRYAYQVCDALTYLHSQMPPIIHRDIKPANIIITDQGQAMLVDFGIFKWFDPQGMTTKGARAVTSGYSPPEQYGIGQTDGRSDIYALGATLYALLSGQHPPDSLDLYFKKTSLPSLRSLNPSVSEPLARVVESAMALRQEQRPQSVGKFRHRLQEAERKLSPPAPQPRPGPTDPAPRQAAQPGRAPLIAPVPPRLSTPPRPVAPRPVAPRPVAPGPVAQRPAAKPTGNTNINTGLAVFMVILALALGGWGLARLMSDDSASPRLPQRAVLAPDNVSGLAVLQQWGRGVVNGIAYSPDGERLAVAASHTVSIYEAASLEHVADYWVNLAATSIAFAPGNEALAAGLLDGRILLWSSWEQAPLELPGHGGFVSSLAFTPNGGLLLAGYGDGRVYLWRVADGTQINLAEGIDAVYAVAASPDGHWLASGGADGTLRLWDARTAAPLTSLVAYEKDALALAFSPDSTILASSGDGGVVNLMRMADNARLAMLSDTKSPVHTIAFSSDENDETTLALGLADGSVRLWTPGEGGARSFVPDAHAGSVNTVAFAPDGRTLASSSGNDTVRLWRVSDGQNLASSNNYLGWVYDLAFAPDGAHVAAALSDRRVARFRLTEGDGLPNLTRHAKAVRSVAFAPNGLAIITGSEDRLVRLWESATGDVLHLMSAIDLGVVNSVAVAPDGATAASGSDDGAVRLWRVADGALLETLPSFATPIWCVAFSPDGSRLAIGLENGSIQVWNLLEQGLQRTLQLEGPGAVRRVAFSPDGATLASVWDGGSVDLWSMADGSRRPWNIAPAKPLSLAFAPDGQLLVVGLDDGTAVGNILVWPVSGNTPLPNIPAHRGAVTAVAFSGDGTTLATGGMDGVVRLWGVEE